jgi:hypothetical protein
MSPPKEADQVVVALSRAVVRSRMASFGRRRHHQDRPTDEDPVVRQYRFLLREASPDAVEVAHTEALPQLQEEQRRVILSAVQRGLVAGQRLRPNDTTQIAHVIVLGERRSPNAFLAACDPPTLLALSRAVIGSEACFGLFGRYVAWDGADPEPEDDSAWADGGFNPDTGRWDPSHDGTAKESGYILGYYGGRGLPHKGRRS